MDFIIGSVALAVTSALGKEALGSWKRKIKQAQIQAKEKTLYVQEQKKDYKRIEN